MAATVGRGGTTVANRNTFLDLPSATLRFSGVLGVGAVVGGSLWKGGLIYVKFTNFGICFFPKLVNSRNYVYFW